MAMEYFDERIVQSLKVHLPGSPLKLSPGFGPSGSYLSGLPAIVTSSSQYGLNLRYLTVLILPMTDSVLQ